MNQPARPISEEDLHGYVDGLLDAERRQAVDNYLQAHADAAERVAADIAQRNALRIAFAPHAAQPIPPRLNLTRLAEERLMRRRTPWRSAAAIVLALALGAAGGWWGGSRSPTGLNALRREAAMSYAVYAVDKRRPVEIWAQNRDDMVRWLSSRLNRPVSPPDISATGYRLLGGRLAASPHGAAALFVYEDTAGHRLILYVRPMPAGRETTAIEPVEAGAVDGCVWIERGIGYSLVGPEPYDNLLEISRHVRQEVHVQG